MTGYSPPEYQLRASRREQRERKRAELTRFILWMYQDAKPLDVPTITDINSTIEDFLNFDAPAVTDGE